jgi:hypothetical protein
MLALSDEHAKPPPLSPATLFFITFSDTLTSVLIRNVETSAVTLVETTNLIARDHVALDTGVRGSTHDDPSAYIRIVPVLYCESDQFTAANHRNRATGMVPVNHCHCRTLLSDQAHLLCH